MTLHIENPRAFELAKQIAELRNISLDDAVLESLRHGLERAERLRRTLDVVHEIQQRLRTNAGPNGRDMTKEEIDAMWGHD